MSKLMVYLADIPGTVEWPSPIRYTIEDLFKEVIQSSSDFSSVKVEWSSQEPTLGTHDLLVYFVDSRSSSVLVKGKLLSAGDLGDTGTTAISGKIAASEVYLSGHQSEPKGLGKLAFHELMHNICLMMDGLHAKKLGLRMGAEEINSGTTLNAKDIALLVKNLTKKRVQWKDGYKFRPKKYAPGDPAADLF